MIQGGWEELLNEYVSAIQSNKTPDSPAGQDLVRRHLEHLKKFGIEVKKEELVEKTHFYLGHPDWKFDGYPPQLLEFIFSAMEGYAKPPLF